MKTKKNTVTKKNEGYEDLYICLNDAPNKRKNILLGIKDSLIMQEEYERILKIRKNKSAILSEIKRNFENLNKDYQELKKALPNIKNTISYTEKELNELEGQVNMLKKDISYNKGNIELDNQIIEQLSESNKNLRELSNKKGNKIKKEINKSIPKHMQLEPVSVVKQKMSKIERIKNNLNVIESKLKNI